MNEQANVATVESTAPETTGGAYTGEWDIDIDAIYSELGAPGDDDVYSEDSAPEAKPVADKPESEKAEEAEGEKAAEPASEPEAAPAAEKPAEDTYTLKHLDETRTVGRDEVIALAQKGMDYDRIREQRDAAASRLDEFEKWLKGVTGGKGLQEFRDDYDASAMAKAQNIDKAVALERIKLERERRELDAERARVAEQQKTDRSALDGKERMMADVQEFMKTFPDVAANMQTDKDTIPAEVWERVRAGERLVDAYGAYKAKKDAAAKDAEIERLKAELEAEKKNKKNAARSAGSQKSDGEIAAFDPIAAGWNSV